MTHTATQPGLHSHSWAPADDLMKRYIVEVKREGQLGWLAMESHDRLDMAYPRRDRMVRQAWRKVTEARVWDNFNNRQVGTVWRTEPIEAAS